MEVGEGSLVEDGFIATKNKEIGREVDDINAELDAGKNPFQDGKGLMFWSKNFGTGNDVSSSSHIYLCF